MPQYKKILKRGVRWFYKFSFQGKIYRSNAIYYSKQDAKKAESIEYNSVEKKQGIVISDSEMYLQDLINERLDYIKVAKSEKYYIESKRYLKLFYEYFGNISIYDLSRGDVQKYLLSQAEQCKSHHKDNYSVNAMLRCYKALFFYGIKFLDLNINNPCTGINFFSINRRIKYIPSDTEISEVLEKCNAEQRLLVEFVRDTGCRISESLNLRRRDVFDGYVILYTRKSKSSNLMPRKVKFDTSRFDLDTPLDIRIFKSWEEVPKFLSKKTNGKWNWHNLRHRYASILSNDGLPLFEIMTLLGHSNLETTQKYLQLLK